MQFPNISQNCSWKTLIMKTKDVEKLLKIIIDNLTKI